jgi:hypothetical protein
MPTRYVYNGSTWVTLGGSSTSDASDQYPSALRSDGVATASSSRTAVTLTASTTPHATTGVTWTELDPSLSGASSGIYVFVQTSVAASTTDTSTLLEFATGAAASEVVWATIPVGFSEGFTIHRVPGLIASGTRVSARVRSAVVSQAVTVLCSFMTPKSSAAMGAPVTYGANTATSQGTVVTPPGTLNTKGAWTTIAASTTAIHNALYLGMQANGATGMAGSGVLLDIGIGAAASETVLVPDVYLLGVTSERYSIRSPTTYGVDIPLGSRLSARYARAAANNLVDLVLVGA